MQLACTSSPLAASTEPHQMKYELCEETSFLFRPAHYGRLLCVSSRYSRVLAYHQRLTVPVALSLNTWSALRGDACVYVPLRLQVF